MCVCVWIEQLYKYCVYVCVWTYGRVGGVCVCVWCVYVCVWTYGRVGGVCVVCDVCVGGGLTAGFVILDTIFQTCKN